MSVICPVCQSLKVEGPDDDGIWDCRSCGVWFDPKGQSRQATAAVERSMPAFLSKARLAKCCHCGYSGPAVTRCDRGPEGVHCNHWWKGHHQAVN